MRRWVRERKIRLGWHRPTAVAPMDPEQAREAEQARFTAFRAHYTFEARLCSPTRGQEKGRVEGLAGFACRNFLVPVPEVTDFEDLNAQLLALRGYSWHVLSLLDQKGTQYRPVLQRRYRPADTLPPVCWWRDGKH